MSDKKLHIKASANGAVGIIEIIGNIGWWQNDSDSFRMAIKQLKDAKTESCLVYLNTYGGSCFDANEMVNILKAEFPQYTAKCGAIVASAGTYIASHAAVVKAVRNCQYMIHKPSAFFSGNEQEMQNQLKLLQNMTAEYYAVYVARLKKPESEFKAKWEAGDFWMSAQEAKEWGFVDEVEDAETLDAPTAQLLQSCGAPKQIQQVINNHIHTEMDIKVISSLLGMKEDSTEASVHIALAALKKKAGDYDVLKAEVERKDAERKTAEIEAVLNKAISEKKINASAKQKWHDLLSKDFESASALLDDLQAPVRLSAGLQQEHNTYDGKTWEQLMEVEGALERLEDENPEQFQALFADYKKRNKLK